MKTVLWKFSTMCCLACTMSMALMLLLTNHLYAQCSGSFSWFGLVPTPAHEKSRHQGGYTEDNSWREHPYTTFDKRKPGWTLAGDIALIRSAIQTPGEFQNLYSALYNDAIGSMPTETHEDSAKILTKANWAKANAFCYLVKLNASATDISSNPTALNNLMNHLSISCGKKVEPLTQKNYS